VIHSFSQNTMGRAIGRWYRPYFRISSSSNVNTQREHRYKGVANTIV
jgi:hypothetical protein